MDTPEGQPTRWALEWYREDGTHRRCCAEGHTGYQGAWDCAARAEAEEAGERPA